MPEGAKRQGKLDKIGCLSGYDAQRVRDTEMPFKILEEVKKNCN
jgi:hypothetical protein